MMSGPLIDILEKMEIPAKKQYKLRQKGINTPPKLFAVREVELTKMFDFDFSNLISFRMLKEEFENSKRVTINSSLLSQLPLFRGNDARSMSEPHKFLEKFERTLKAVGIREMRWHRYLLMCLKKDEDASYWQQYMDANPSASWKAQQAAFLQHFGCYEQRSKWIDAIHELAQGKESVQAYLDKASELVTRAGLELNDSQVVRCIRKGFRSPKLIKFLSIREDPDEPYNYYTLTKAALLGEARLEDKTKKKESKKPAKESGKCFRCGKPGHVAKSCPSTKRSAPSGAPPKENPAKKPQYTPCTKCVDADHPFSRCPKNVCNFCKKNGHLATLCPDVTCRACGKKGHTAAAFVCDKHPSKAKGKYLFEFNGDTWDEVQFARKLKVGWHERAIALAALSDKSTDDGRLTIPVTIQGKQFFALLDTGATHSILAIEAVIELDIENELMQSDKVIQSALKMDTDEALKMTQPLEVLAGDFSVVHSFYVADIRKSVIIGMDLMSRLGMSIQGLPFDYPRPVTEQDPQEGIEGSATVTDET
ncbi:MAG: hypothetical protein OJI67_01995, partial [Prosthecobacter sp.]|nr:hypothetical protein [Prosthecobacter sp.]